MSLLFSYSMSGSLISGGCMTTMTSPHRTTTAPHHCDVFTLMACCCLLSPHHYDGLMAVPFDPLVPFLLPYSCDFGPVFSSQLSNGSVPATPESNSLCPNPSPDVLPRRLHVATDFLLIFLAVMACWLSLLIFHRNCCSRPLTDYPPWMFQAGQLKHLTPPRHRYITVSHF